MDADAIKALLDEGKLREPVRRIYEDREQIWYLVEQGGGQPATIQGYCKPPVCRDHQVTTLPSFAGYLAERAPDANGLVWVGEKSVVADLAYLSQNPQRVTMCLREAEEFEALRKLCSQAWSQRELWRLLVTDLDGCIDRSLALQIRGIRTTGKAETNIEIEPSGLTSGSAGSTIAVTYRDPSGAGAHTAEIADQFDWRGRIWECFGVLFTVGLRLELEVGEKGLTFRFWPRRIETELARARLALVDALRQQVPAGYTVHEGML